MNAARPHARRKPAMRGAAALLLPLLSLLLILGASGCTPCNLGLTCKEDKDCPPGLLCFSQEQFYCKNMCNYAFCIVEADFACRDDLTCYTDPEEHPFGEHLEDDLFGTDQDGNPLLGQCYYAPGDPRIPDYDDDL